MFTQNFTKPNHKPDGSVSFDDPDYPMQPGDTVVPFFPAGTNQDKDRAKALLKEGQKYTVRQVEVYPLRTDVFLEPFSVSFNIVNLEKIS